jgi:septal ring factor EnvC (AmiA/AmiB activator)
LEDEDPYYLPLKAAMCSNNGSESSKSPANLLQAVLAVAFVLLTLTGVCLHQSNTQISRLLTQHETELDHQLDYLTELEDQMRRRENQRTELKNQIVQLEQRPPIGEDGLEAQRKVFHLEHSTTMIQQGIQVNARKMVQEK